MFLFADSILPAKRRSLQQVSPEIPNFIRHGLKRKSGSIISDSSSAKPLTPLPVSWHNRENFQPRKTGSR
jgi:hypothetical protein